MRGRGRVPRHGQESKLSYSWILVLERSKKPQQRTTLARRQSLLKLLPLRARERPQALHSPTRQQQLRRRKHPLVCRPRFIPPRLKKVK